MTLAVMHRDSDAQPDAPDRTSPAPRWVDVLVTSLLAALALVVLALVGAYVMSGPDDNLAGVALVAAAALMVPLSVASALAGAGVWLRRRYPRGALVVSASSAGVAGLTLLLVAAVYVGGL